MGRKAEYTLERLLMPERWEQVKKAVDWVRWADRQYPCVYCRLEFGLSWESATRQLLGYESLPPFSPLCGLDLQRTAAPVLVLKVTVCASSSLHPFLVTLYTTDFSHCTESCHLQRFPDDSAVVGCISESDESAYRAVVDSFVTWCEQNQLQLNVSKTKELIMDFRKTRKHLTPVSIQRVDVDIVEGYKYLGLHNQTNLFLLSLAVSDFLVGLLLMPPRILLLGGCWVLGTFMCGLFYYASFVLTSASVGNMVLISFDRYVAICDPLSYPTTVTERKVQISVCLCWACSLLYNGTILNNFLKQPDRYNSCDGECIVVIDFITGAFDVVVTFIGPTAVIIFLYVRVFLVAASHAQAMRSHVAFVTSKGSVHIRKSERKAATTIGVVVVVFLMCFCPYFYPSLAGQDTSTSVEFSVFGVWLLYCNSCLNPLIYAFFYPWFRKTVKLIVMLQILQPDSCDANIL
ncbi:trace amine-associated receptor 13c-like [Neolamprologus brichardi]|uniref:trace amine-associated receptor 13c-like n=1 Tax=Neolamprologus brichardi TaxID=32507 RepID=UPI001643889C|nr:trace amine-associated receptor 13c-like [Neolamprologus brichardi]